MKNVVERPTFWSIDSIEENSLAVLRCILNEEFQKFFEGWKRC
jgi:hypothetical protein